MWCITDANESGILLIVVTFIVKNASWTTLIHEHLSLLEFCCVYNEKEKDIISDDQRFLRTCFR